MWRTTLLDLIATGRYSTQGDLVDALEVRGFAVTQSSVSRELSNQGVTKVGGRYLHVAAAGLPGSIRVLDASTSVGAPLVVLKTTPAAAPLLASAVDKAQLAGVLGTLAGDDTVFVACANFDTLPRLEEFLGRPLDSNYGGTP